MRKLTCTLALLLLTANANASYYLFEKESIAKHFKSQIPFKIKDFGEYWQLGKFKDKNTALSFQNEFFVRFGFTPKVGHFASDKDFSEYVRLKESYTMINLLRDLENLKRKIKTVRDPRFNSCYFINRINAVERCILKEFDLKANFPRLVEKIYYRPGICTKVEPVNGLITKNQVAEELKRIIDRYSVYQHETAMLKEILNEIYSTF